MIDYKTIDYCKWTIERWSTSGTPYCNLVHVGPEKKEVTLKVEATTMEMLWPILLKLQTLNYLTSDNLKLRISQTFEKQEIQQTNSFDKTLKGLLVSRSW